MAVIHLLVDIISLENTLFKELQYPKTQSLEEDIRNTKDPTEKILKEMFVENTGANILDSGSAYGRHWQENRRKWPWRKDDVSVEFWDDWINVSANTFTHILNFLTYEQKLDEAFHKFAAREEYRYDPWLTLMERWVDNLVVSEKYARDVFGLPEGKRIKVSYITTFNTYNDEDSMLDHILQGVMLYVEGDILSQYYLILQIHLGCDVRGGYSTPHVFSGVSEDELFQFVEPSIGFYLPTYKKYFIMFNPYEVNDQETGEVLTTEEFVKQYLMSENNIIYEKLRAKTGEIVPGKKVIIELLSP